VTDDPFEALGMPATFRLDADAVRSAHRRLASRFHPDRAASPTEAAEFARRSAVVNDAAGVLADPLRRAEALLRRSGAAAADRLPAEFLVEMMELREALDEARAAGDAERAAALADDVDRRTAALVDALAGLFDAIAAAGGDERTRLVREAAREVAVLRYLERFRAAVRDGHPHDDARRG
jgi:molecular chaperone HscB